MNKYWQGDRVMLCSGKYISYIADFDSYLDGGRKVKVKLDLSPERIVRTLVLLEERCIDSISTLRLKKPTLGLRPFNIWIYNRIQEIKDALQRQSLAGEDLNMAWVLEMQEITEMVKEK
jgi:hypothetical protein